MIEINFDETYDLLEVSEDFSITSFFSPNVNGINVLISVQIFPLSHPLLPNVYNLAFGPIKSSGEIDDQARIRHTNLSKLFSTILLASLTFLQAHPERIIGLDGSDDIRAYLYHRMFQKNRNNLDSYFMPSGVDWFVRLMRNETLEVDSDGVLYFQPIVEPFDYKRLSTNLYRYYLFKLK